MEHRALLNEIYEPFHRAGVEALRAIRALGYDAKMGYYNLHEVKVDGVYEKEFFPLPEITIFGIATSADCGIALDKTAWLELTIPREQALAIDYVTLANTTRLEVYGADAYLVDFYNAEMSIEPVRALIEASTEREIHLYFPLPDCDGGAIQMLLKQLCALRLIPDAQARGM